MSDPLDSPLVRRKLARSIDIGRQPSRDQYNKAGRGDGGRAPHEDDAPAPIDPILLEKSLQYLRPAVKGNPRIDTHVSRAKRDAVGEAQNNTLNIDTRGNNIDPANLPNLGLGYVGMGRMTERDRHAGNYFANDCRSVSRLFEEDRGASPGRKGRSASPASPSKHH